METEKEVSTYNQQGGQNPNPEEKLINILFTELTSIKSGWRASFQSDQELLNNTKRIWLTAFKENGINSIALLKAGLKKTTLDESDFLPSIGKFIRWCKESEFPSIDEAFTQASKFIDRSNETTWLHACVYDAACKYGCHELKRDNAKEAEAKYRRLYNESIDDFLAGKPITHPPILKQIEKKDFVPLQKKDHDSNFSQLSEMMGHDKEHFERKRLEREKEKHKEELIREQKKLYPDLLHSQLKRLVEGMLDKENEL